ncbi:hypothetical protein JOC77_004328 [Peribacillus deserti]|uniref:Toxin SymE-like domain-containing protein n=1 Tax=Peribacillus deserti TaxID=673318 RepID=A0ABS2QQ80_9BACI|nr:hypothetical protein [Peribacillus deserti]MBM7694849.1 hypothetical protein [Peribacillus deserti]
MSSFLYFYQPYEKQTPERRKKSGSERLSLPFDGDWLTTEGVSPELDNTEKLKAVPSKGNL